MDRKTEKLIEELKEDIRNYEKKIRTAPPEIRNKMKIDVKKFRSRLKAVEAELDT